VSTKSSFKRGDTVRYKGRVRAGRGTIKIVRQTGRGLWYGVETKEGDTLFVRVSGLTAVA
jgi:hypothetical protein